LAQHIEAQAHPHRAFRDGGRAGAFTLGAGASCGKEQTSMNMTIRVQLSMMMFIQFFIWGAWYVTMGTYLSSADGLGFAGADVGRAYSAAAWAAIISPFFVGMVADRFFSAEKVLGVLHLLGGVLMLVLTTITTPGAFFVVLVLYTLCYMPTLALVNAISFHRMTDPGTQFPGVRVLGTAGWIIAGLCIMMLEWAGMAGIEASVLPFQIAAGASFLMGIYSFTLPNTPPKGRHVKVSARDIMGLDALALMKERSFAVFVVSSLLICIPLAFYYTWSNYFLNDLGMEGTAGKMTMGQMSEVLFMLVMPFFFRRLGFKYMLLIGMGAWALRYVLFAYGDVQPHLVWMLYGGILLHGICYDFFFVTGQIYVDKKAPKEIQASAQGFITLITYGVGMVIGTNVAGMVADMYTDEGVYNWSAIWMFPAIMALVVSIGFAILFNERNGVEDTEGTVLEAMPGDTEE